MQIMHKVVPQLPAITVRHLEFEIHHGKKPDILYELHRTTKKKKILYMMNFTGLLKSLNLVTEHQNQGTYNPKHGKKVPADRAQKRINAPFTMFQTGTVHFGRKTF
jgi:hypothetical protein